MWTMVQRRIIELFMLVGALAGGLAVAEEITDTAWVPGLWVNEGEQRTMTLESGGGCMMAETTLNDDGVATEEALPCTWRIEDDKLVIEGKAAKGAKKVYLHKTTKTQDLLFEGDTFAFSRDK